MLGNVRAMTVPLALAISMMIPLCMLLCLAGLYARKNSLKDCSHHYENSFSCLWCLAVELSIFVL